MAFVVVDEDEFRKELQAATEEHRAELAKEALDVAVGLAGDISDTGALAESLEVSGDDGSILGTTDPVGHIKEWGSTYTPPHAVLRRAAEAVGAEVEDEGPE